MKRKNVFGGWASCADSEKHHSKTWSELFGCGCISQHAAAAGKKKKQHITDTALTFSSKVIALSTRHLPVCAAYKLEQVQSHSHEVVGWLSEEMLQLSIWDMRLKKCSCGLNLCWDCPSTASVQTDALHSNSVGTLMSSLRLIVIAISYSHRQVTILYFLINYYLIFPAASALIRVQC